MQTRQLFLRIGGGAGLRRAGRASGRVGQGNGHFLDRGWPLRLEVRLFVWIRENCVVDCCHLYQAVSKCLLRFVARNHTSSLGYSRLG